MLGFAITFAGLTIGTACVASEVCGAIVLAITPDGAALAPGLAGLVGTAAGSIAGTRIAAIFEEAMVNAEAEQATQAQTAYDWLSRALDALPPCTPNSFAGDTPVLLAAIG